MYRIFGSLCLKIKRYSYHRQGKSRGHLPMLCSWLIHSTWTLTAARSPVVTVKPSWTWELLRVPAFNFYSSQIPCRGLAEDAHWSPSDGTPCRCSQHPPFGKVPEREVLPGPGTLEHTIQREAGWAFPHPLPCIGLVF